MTPDTGKPQASNASLARALWLPAAGRCRMGAETLPPPADGEVLVRMLYSGISRGTEDLVFNGRVPPAEFQRMRCPHMGGGFPFPVKYGYAAVGQVEAGKADLIGSIVFCLHPHQDLFVVGSEAAVPLPGDLPPARAVLAANMETALNIIWDAGILPGDRVAVFGAGVVGTLVAYLASRIVGTQILLIDRNPERQAMADHLGIAFALNPATSGDFDVVINASGSGDALAQAIELAGQEARIIEASWYGDKPVTLPLGGAFHARRLIIASSQVGSVPASRRARWTFARRLAKALDLLRDERLDVLINAETRFADLEIAYPGILSNPETLCHRISYQE